MRKKYAHYSIFDKFFSVPNLRNSKQIDFFRRALAKLRKAK